jgi:hypothetical protein
MPGLSAKFSIITVLLEFLKKLYFIVLMEKFLKQYATFYLAGEI